MGSSGTNNGQFNTPGGVATDSSKNVYVADSLNNRVQKFNSAGTYITQWGITGSNNGQFNRPIGAAVSGSSVFVADLGNSRIEKFDSNGGYITQFGGVHGGELIGIPYYVAFDSGNNIYVADERTFAEIAKFTGNGTILLRFGSLWRGEWTIYGGGRPRDGQQQQRICFRRHQ